ncbi:hypothetical protein NX059_005624 [Plenodomus lindquistii]|nr:hypothetical protein NX059_005624 [Plenodomus lindquistii]
MPSGALFFWQSSKESALCWDVCWRRTHASQCLFQHRLRSLYPSLNTVVGFSSHKRRLLASYCLQPTEIRDVTAQHGRLPVDLGPDLELAKNPRPPIKAGFENNYTK